jgi:hypothetical protein
MLPLYTSRWFCFDGNLVVSYRACQCEEGASPTIAAGRVFPATKSSEGANMSVSQELMGRGQLPVLAGIHAAVGHLAPVAAESY